MVASLRGVIAKQAAEIEALQSKLKELSTSLATAAPATTPEAPQPTAKFAEVRDTFFFAFFSPLHLGVLVDVVT